jgi:hypothetical protein
MQHAMRSITRLVVTALLVLPACTVATGQPVTTPAEHLGRPVGVDFELADWNEVGSYYRRLGEESPNAVTTVAGTTTEGRDFLVTTISSPENLARLDEITARTAVIADPRGRSEAEKRDAVENGRTVLFVSCGMHATEAAGAQLGIEFAHALATSDEEPWRTARAELVVIVFSTNPDGLDQVVEWYRETVGTPHEATGLLELYQRYAGHDNNRDWFMLTQAETRIVTRMLYREWHPQVYWDVHQQGSSRERFFVPPFRDPLNPNLDPAIITGIDALGSRTLMDLTREGFTGVSTGVSYDMWWNGGNRNVPVRHNIIGLLTEAASVRLASPIFLRRSDLAPPRGLDGYAPSNQFPAPWPGGWWRLRDIIDYQMAFGRSVLASLAREPEFWRRNALEAAERTIRAGREDAPRAWIVPSDNRDPDAVRRLVDVLIQSGVEIHVADDAVEADGRTYPPGSIVIDRAQPYGAHVKDLLEVQRYPGGKPPYDVAGWTLPFLLGVRRVEVMTPPEGPLRMVTTADDAVARFGGDPRRQAGAGDVLSIWSSGTWPTLVERLGRGETWTMATTGDDGGLVRPGDSGDDDDATRVRLPRIGLYAPWSGSMSEGWMRYVLDTYGVPYTRVRNEMLRAGALHDFLDVLLIPAIRSGQLDEGRPPGSVAAEYTRGLAPEGAVAVEEFVRGGGTLVTVGASSTWAIDLLELPLVDVSRGPDAEGFSCPGSVVRTIPTATHPLAVGLPRSLPVFFSRSSAWRTMTPEERQESGREERTDIVTLLRYAPSRVLLSGWINEPEVMEGRAAWLRVPYGDGRVHLFAFPPHYRGWAQGSFGLLFRAMMLDGEGA